MKKFRGFLLKNRVVSVFRFIRRRGYNNINYHRLTPPHRSLSVLVNWGARIKAKAKAICSKTPGLNSGYSRFRQDPEMETGHGHITSYGVVPKGKMAVYVGRDDDGDYERVLVPVVYINHPLFVQLLMKAEEEYGYKHPGGIIIPCPVSEFENVKTRIDAVCGGRKLMTWKRSRFNYYH